MLIEVQNNGVKVDEVTRKPFHKGFLGNFVPHYVRYKNKVYVLQGGWDYAYMHGEPSEAWIELTKPCQRKENPHVTALRDG